MERRIPSFPVTIEITPATRFTQENCKLYYAHEWEAYQKSLHPDEPAASSPESDGSSPAALSDPSAPQPDSAAPLSDLPISESPVAATAFQDSSSGVPAASAAVASLPSPLPPDFSRHTRRCCVCSHPDRDAIEADFIRWRSPELIAQEYKIPNRASIYRHAHCTGLYQWRRRELGRVLEGILESAEHVPLSSAAIVIHAARVYAHLNEHGNWFEPPRTNFLLMGSASPAPLGETRRSASSGRTRSRRVAAPRLVRASNRNSPSIRKKAK